MKIKVKIFLFYCLFRCSCVEMNFTLVRYQFEVDVHEKTVRVTLVMVALAQINIKKGTINGNKCGYARQQMSD